MDLRYLGNYEFEVIGYNNMNLKGEKIIKAKWFEVSLLPCFNTLNDPSGNKKVVFGYKSYPDIIAHLDDKPTNTEDNLK